MDWVHRLYRRLFGFRRCSEAMMLAADLDLELAEHQLSLKMARSQTSLLAEDLKTIREGFESPRPTEQIAAAIELRKRLAETYSTDRLRWMLAHLRGRFVAALGPDKARESVNGVTDLRKAKKDELIAEAHSVLEQLKLQYTLVIDRDSRVNRIRSVAVVALLALFLGLALVPAYATEEVMGGAYSVKSLISFAVVFIAASAGSIVSILQRSGGSTASLFPAGQDPIRQISALRHGIGGVFVSVLMGPALAIVLVAIFIGGMIQIDGLTPEILPCLPEKPTPDQSSSGKFAEICTFSMLDHEVGLRGPADAAKLLLWAFLAGFAERLVPDVLDRFVGAAKTKPDA